MRCQFSLIFVDFIIICFNMKWIKKQELSDTRQQNVMFRLILYLMLLKGLWQMKYMQNTGLIWQMFLLTGVPR